MSNKYSLTKILSTMFSKPVLAMFISVQLGSVFWAHLISPAEQYRNLWCKVQYLFTPALFLESLHLLVRHRIKRRDSGAIGGVTGFKTEGCIR